MTVFTAHIEGVENARPIYKIFENEESAWKYLEAEANKYVGAHDNMEAVEAVGCVFVVWKHDKNLTGQAYFRHLATHSVYKMYVTEDHVFTK